MGEIARIDTSVMTKDINMESAADCQSRDLMKRDRLQRR
jgi:hypothetical protein